MVVIDWRWIFCYCISTAPRVGFGLSGAFLWGWFVKVLIDGENLRHQIAHVLEQHKKIRDKNAHFGFDLVGFLQDALRVKSIEATYYTTRIKQPMQKVPVKLQKHITAISSANRRWVADLTNQDIVVVKAGYLRVRESSPCIHCGKKTLVLQEKGVDVRIATDLLRSGQGNAGVILVSSDSDLAPALDAVRQMGLQVTYFCYAGWLNRSVASQAHKTITFDDDMVLKHFRGSKNEL
jgi:uncharacterized LabA/DUF88 family protein